MLGHLLMLHTALAPAVAESTAPTRADLTADVVTWNDKRVLYAAAGPVYRDLALLSDQDQEALPYLTAGYNHPLHKRFMLGGGVGLMRWEVGSASSFGYPPWWAIDIMAIPRLRLPFGRRGRAGMLISVPGGLTLDVAPTPESLVVVEEEAGLGVGWNVGLELGIYCYTGPRLAIGITNLIGIQRFRHNWTFHTPDGTLDGQREIARYETLRVGATFGLLVAL